MRVRDLMSRPVVTIERWETCQEAVARMARTRVRHLPVVGADARLVGVVTDRDLRHALLAPCMHEALGSTAIDTLLQALPVEEIMSAPAVSVAADEDLLVAANVMLEDKVGCLPVVDRGYVVGILTETDLLRQICRADAARSPEVAEIVVSYP
jgi:acetoin utilization protein AcuB